MMWPSGQDLRVSAVVLNGVSRNYGSVRAVHDLTLSVARGEFLALLGPSGCGKTTSLRIIAGFVQPGAGEVFVDGKAVTHLPPHRRDTGMVFQSYALFPHLTVEKNIAFGLKMRGVGRTERLERVREVMRLVHIEGLENRLPAQLSGGQQQRVALARALVINPSVLLLDEPLSNLDAKLRQEMREELKRLQRKLGITTILVTHDQEEALVLADRIAVMFGGRIEQVGDAVSIYKEPVSRAVATFIGACNLLPTVVSESHGEWVEVKLLRSGTLIRARTPVVDLDAGTRGDLLIRPESILVISPDHTPAEERYEDTHSGILCETSFRGSYARCSLRIGDDLVLADLPAATMGQLRCGGEVKIRIDGNAARFFPESVTVG